MTTIARRFLWFGRLLWAQCTQRQCSRRCCCGTSHFLRLASLFLNDEAILRAARTLHLVEIGPPTICVQPARDRSCCCCCWPNFNCDVIEPKRNEITQFGGFVFIAYLVVHELKGKGRFANTTTAHHDDFVDHGLSCFGRFGSHFLLLRLDGRSLVRPPRRRRWGRHRLFVKQETLKLCPTTSERAPGPAAAAGATVGRCGGGRGPVDFALGRTTRIAGRRRRRWPGKGKDLGMIRIFGFLPTFLESLGNWKTKRIRPFRHWLSDRIPILSHFDAHFLFFLLKINFTTFSSHETTKATTNKTKKPPNVYGAVSTDRLTKSWPYSLSFSSQKKQNKKLVFPSLSLSTEKTPPPSSSCFELSLHARSGLQRLSHIAARLCSLWHSPVG